MKRMTNGTSRRALLVAAAAGIITAGLTTAAVAGDAKPENVHCYGINKCKGTGDCSGKGHQCSGQNACKGQGHINLPKDVCLRIEGGHLVANPGDEG